MFRKFKQLKEYIWNKFTQFDNWTMDNILQVHKAMGLFVLIMGSIIGGSIIYLSWPEIKMAHIGVFLILWLQYAILSLAIDRAKMLESKVISLKRD